MGDYRITAVCEAGHVQQINLRSFERERAEMFAGLLDGSALASPSTPDSVIGKCGVCSKAFRASVEPLA